MDQLYRCACNDNREVLLYLDPMHQIHNNENDYAWQPTGRAGTKKYWPTTEENGSILLVQLTR